MSSFQGIPKSALITINDMLDQCAKIQAGQEVVILAHIDGLYGGDNLVDSDAISWIHQGVMARDANPSILWIDEKPKAHEWRLPPVVKAAIESSDVFINHSLDLEREEFMEIKKLYWNTNKIFVRNFATTAALLCTKWAQTPYELVSEIRYQASLPFKPGESWQIKDDNGTHLEGIINAEFNPQNFAYADPEGNVYSRRREDNRPFPEWMHPAVGISNTNGILIFDRMLGWWARYIGISPYFANPIQLTIDNSRITKIDGGEEADTLRKFLEMMKGFLGEGVFAFTAMHFGVHPQAFVEEYQCPSILYRRLIEHSHSSNVHFHIGAPKPTDSYPYWMHCTADIRSATFQVGNTIVHDRGYLTALDNHEVRSIASKYPGRPGLNS